MNAGATSDRIYEHIRHFIGQRHVRPGLRLDPRAIAKELEASTTPVREALNRLVGEGLVETLVPGGFFVLTLDEPVLRDLYSWSRTLIGLSLRSGTLAGHDPSRLGRGEDYADRVASLFTDLAYSSNNTQYRIAMRRLNANLHAIRHIESEILEDVEGELEELKIALTEVPGASIGKVLKSYHQRRLRSSFELIRRRQHSKPYE
ncbi:regulatory GntR family protein [Novosphingobium sp. PhB165]|uniref:GntR family transcriptional regulator n=1 Tax=Novosphingobium sp. PhB165 TaxID=2485105 RepID=UPI0010493DFD|nr:GntR family transcriptional regulator [Novosphingobium sp. PhB165]TCM13008.1 regulatory GntR family protein [Novosphingobium sp. PhB165]